MEVALSVVGDGLEGQRGHELQKGSQGRGVRLRGTAATVREVELDSHRATYTTQVALTDLRLPIKSRPGIINILIYWRRTTDVTFLFFFAWIFCCYNLATAEMAPGDF